eukprot:CAMPEP_0176365432 /NCGR_PEP_ID=MMETSP0126-20121128/20477_1 /TAXON_ID=141414 ORGANISM="Strombidinopsis acuminatum, Strain SPMC142" /NCGR_SAMPLE_ID=MMETSP0126 /ASSEMBLY_ACC=CAM_ASM_000229 /LENGTH=101 /DNA_ID=CAMNT_0017722453 /DNA_START=259 /DNA_END=564 /DNA_ORIENTATION=+
MTYCFDHKILYVCNEGDREILAFKIRIDSASNVSYENKIVIVDDVDCAGVETDKFSDFYYVDTVRQEINKIHVEKIEKAFDNPINLTPEFLYGANSTETMH